MHTSFSHPPPALIAKILFRDPGLPGSLCIQGMMTGSHNYTFAKPVPWTVCRCIHHNVLYLWHVCSLVQRVFRSDVHHVIHMQSCICRRLAHRQLKGLKAKACSVSKFKEISHHLENKGVELTLMLQKGAKEKNEVATKLSVVEFQLRSWMSRHKEVDVHAKQLTSDLAVSQSELSRHDELLCQKEAIEKCLEEVVA